MLICRFKAKELANKLLDLYELNYLKIFHLIQGPQGMWRNIKNLFEKWRIVFELKISEEDF